jgi:hypothetical protein
MKIALDTAFSNTMLEIALRGTDSRSGHLNS